MPVIRHVETGSDEHPVAHYYAFESVIDAPITQFQNSAAAVVQAIPENALRGSREEYARSAANYDQTVSAEVSLTAESTQDYKDVLATLAQGSEIHIDKKTRLYKLSGFVDTVLALADSDYPELEDEALTELVMPYGVFESTDDLAAATDGEQVVSWLNDVVNNDVFSREAWMVEFPQAASAELVPESVSPEYRKVCAAYFMVRARLATGALYAAGISGDEQALVVSRQLDQIIS